MNVSSKRLKANKFGCWVVVIGIIEYIFGPKHVMERSRVLDLAEEGLCFGMDRSVNGCDADDLTKNLLNKQGSMQRSSLYMKMPAWW